VLRQCDGSRCDGNGLQFANLLAGNDRDRERGLSAGPRPADLSSRSQPRLIVVRNCVMLLAAMVVIVNFVVDVLYAFIDRASRCITYERPA